MTLQSNAKINVLYAEKGRGLLERIGREGMNEGTPAARSSVIITNRAAANGSCSTTATTPA